MSYRINRYQPPQRKKRFRKVEQCCQHRVTEASFNFTEEELSNTPQWHFQTIRRHPRNQFGHWGVFQVAENAKNLVLLQFSLLIRSGI